MAKDKDSAWLIGVGLGILFALIVLIIIFSQKEEIKEVLTENDFQILGAYWDTYHMKWTPEGALIIDTPQREYNWTLICDCKNSVDLSSCVTSAWYVKTKASEDLLCESILNGQTIITRSGDLTARETLLREGISDFSLSENLKTLEDNEITLCCKVSNGKKEGEICKSIILSAKCS